MGTTFFLALLSFLIKASIANGSASATYSYTDDDGLGPNSWSLLDFDGNECDGSRQSPIDLDTTSKECTIEANFKFIPGNCDLVATITDHVVQATFNTGCYRRNQMVAQNGQRYIAQSFHIHSSSEHTFDGQQKNFELHIVHKGQADLSVIGILIQAEEGDSNSNAVFQKLLDAWTDAQTNVQTMCQNGQTSAGTAATSTLQNFDIYQLLPEKTAFYQYHGSLTTPPCTEIVLWNVAETPFVISQQQAGTLRNLIVNYVSPDDCAQGTTKTSTQGTSNRPTQPLNGRRVERICAREPSRVLVWITVGAVGIFAVGWWCHIRNQRRSTLTRRLEMSYLDRNE